MGRLLSVLLGLLIVTMIALIGAKFIFAVIPIFIKITIYLIGLVIFLLIILAIKNKNILSEDHEEN